MTLKITVKSKTGLDRIPGSVYQCSPFKWMPEPFGVESEYLYERIIEPSVQKKSLEQFTENPQLPCIYAIAGSPDDSQAKLFAAYLASLHVAKLKSNAHVEWHNVSGSFYNPYSKQLETEPTMIVLANLSPVAVNTKLDKVRDIVERFPNIPKILVLAGEDPISFVSTRLHLPCHLLAYFVHPSVRRRIEVI